MNENLNLIEILKDCPKGTKLYSPLFGDVFLLGAKEGDDYPIIIKVRLGEKGISISFKGYDLEYLLFPAKDQRDWNKFKAPWLKKSKFDPKNLHPFDKVLIRCHDNSDWFCNIFSHIEPYGDFCFCSNDTSYKMCIPYNEDTKHLVGTTEEAPEYYRYWED